MTANDPKTAPALGVRYGLVLAAVLVVYGIAFRLLELDFRSFWTQLFYLAVALFCLLAQWSYRQAHDETRFARRLGTGTLATLIGSAAYGAYVFLYNRFVDDSLLHAVVDWQRQTLIQNGMSGEELANTMAQVEQTMTPAIFALFVFLRMFLTGFVVALVGAVLLRRWRTPERATVATGAAS